MIRKSVYAASALPDTNTSSLLAYSRFLNRSRYSCKTPFGFVSEWSFAISSKYKIKLFKAQVDLWSGSVKTLLDPLESVADNDTICSERGKI